MKQAAVLDEEEEQAAVDEAQQLLMQVQGAEPALGQVIAQPFAGGMADEALAEIDQRPGDAVAQFLPRPLVSTPIEFSREVPDEKSLVGRVSVISRRVDRGSYFFGGRPGRRGQAPGGG